MIMPAHHLQHKSCLIMVSLLLIIVVFFQIEWLKYTGMEETTLRICVAKKTHL
jgi:hypothetical protein